MKPPNWKNLSIILMFYLAGASAMSWQISSGISILEGNPVIYISMAFIFCIIGSLLGMNLLFEPQKKKKKDKWDKMLEG